MSGREGTKDEIEKEEMLEATRSKEGEDPGSGKRKKRRDRGFENDGSREVL